jgi:hypothetical protein
LQTAQQTMSHLGNRFDVRRTLGWNEIARTDNNCWNCCGILLLDARGVHHCWWQLCAGVCTRHQRRHDGSWKWLLLQQAWHEGRHVCMRLSQRSKNWRRRRHLIPFFARIDHHHSWRCDGGTHRRRFQAWTSDRRRLALVTIMVRRRSAAETVHSDFCLFLSEKWEVE